MHDLLLQFWGKAQPRDESPRVRWHPLAYHSLDVAAVGHVLLTRDRDLGFLSQLLGLDHAAATDLLSLLLAIHDIGKLSRPFQAKAPAHYPAALGELPEIADPGHGSTSLAVWLETLDSLAAERFADPQSLDPLVKAVFGHHGRPIVESGGLGVNVLLGPVGLEAASDFWQAMADLLLPGESRIEVSEAHALLASYPVAGFAVLCDWLGSNQHWFPYAPPDLSLDRYWREQALPGAERAVQEAGVLPAECRPVSGYRALAGRDFSARPMQEWAEAIEIPEGPALFLIEDDTASGKTEAAVMLAHRLIEAGRASGLYVALPTMATANAMYQRMGEIYRRLFTADSKPSLALAHSARDLHPGFRQAILPAGRREPSYGPPSAADDPEEVTASTACADWIADDRRRTFFADVGVGTIDQALLAVLPRKFQSLRLFGLCRRVLVLDEIHAYDAYMQQEIETLLKFQAAFGGSAILLSATLPDSMRHHLVSAFKRGLGDETLEEMAHRRPYPLATVASRDEHLEDAVPASRTRSVGVRLLDMPEDAFAEVEQAARDGCAALYIRNSVDDAIEAAQTLADRGLAPMLFHARFALQDRLAREREVIDAFGKDTTPRVRAGKVLVATQVVEQSLDLDFDLIVSDLAPIDLLIQRAGRLWRHQERARPRSRCELLVVSPSPVESPDHKWFRRLLPRAASVYQNHAQLWLTARLLSERGAIESPGSLRRLIESVYGPSADDAAPEALSRFWIEAEGRDGADRSLAHQNVLKLEDGYVRGSGAWDADVRTPTRLSEDDVVLRLARWDGELIVPWATDSTGSSVEPWRAWRLSECRARRYQVQGEISWPPGQLPAVTAARASWARFDDEKVLVLLKQWEGSTTESWRGSVQGDNGGPRNLTYSTWTGLRFDDS